MRNKSPIGIFIAATAILTANSINPDLVNAGGRNSEIGGLKEWTTDQNVEEDGQLDEAAKKQREKAKKEDVCIPIGEGENCW